MLSTYENYPVLNILKFISLDENSVVLFQILLQFVRKGPINNNPSLHEPVTSHYL